MLQDLVIFQKTYDLILWLYPAVNKFPKSQRFVLGQQVENMAIQVLKDIIVANQEINKTVSLKKISVDLDEFRILIRLSKDLRFFSIKQYEMASLKINEIGRLLNGWTRKFA